MTLEGGFETLPPAAQRLDVRRVEEVMLELAAAMRDNYPYFHPLYAGQMLKPPHPVARMGYMLALWINPNNHALDAGRASSRMEKEAVAEIAGIFGWDRFLGHLTGGGTMANMEALWVSGKLAPGKKVVASAQAHYTHRRLSEVLGLPFEAVACDARARMDLNELRKLLDGGEVGTVVATMGTTGTGSVDPLAELFALKAQYGFRLHADAAYGGYFALADNLAQDTRRAFAALCRGRLDRDRPPQARAAALRVRLRPFPRPRGRPVLQARLALHLFHLRRSFTWGRSAWSAPARGLPPWPCGSPRKCCRLCPAGSSPGACRSRAAAALALHARVAADRRFRTIIAPELDILVWAPAGESAGRISARSQQVFKAAADKDLHLALFSYPSAQLQSAMAGSRLRPAGSHLPARLPDETRARRLDRCDLGNPRPGG